MMIPQDFIDDLLAKVDIVDIIDQYVPLKKGGANYMACCPFHKEKSPSFSVSPSKQFYHCFGCGVSGTAISFIMKYQGVGFVEAVQFLADRVGMVVPRAQHESPEQIAQRAEKKKQQHTLENTVQVACDFYCQQLSLHQQAIDYLNKRGLSSEVIAHYSIGYAPDGWQSLAQLFQPYPSASLIDSGMVLVNENGRQYDRFRHRIMFPIRGIDGNVIGFGGRVLDDSKPKYLNSPDTPLFDKGKNLYGLYEARAAIKEANKILVVEGYMDVVALAQFDVGYAVAALGTATTAEHIKLLFRQTDDVYFCFDGDEAGRKAAWRALQNALPQLKDDKSLHFLFLPANHDPDSYVREFGKAQFEEALLHESLPLSAYFYRSLTNNLDINTQEGKAELVKHAAPLLAQVSQAPTLAYLLKQQLSEITGIDPVNLAQLMQQSAPLRHVAAKTYHLPRQSFRQPETLTLVQKQIRALLFNPEWAQFVAFPDFLPVRGEAVCLLELAMLYQKNPHLMTAQALEHFRDTPHSGILQHIFNNARDNQQSWQDDSEEAKIGFIEGMNRLIQQIKSEQIDELKARNLSGSLNDVEKKILLQLLMLR